MFAPRLVELTKAPRSSCGGAADTVNINRQILTGPDDSEKFAAFITRVIQVFPHNMNLENDHNRKIGKKSP